MIRAVAGFLCILPLLPLVGGCQRKTPHIAPATEQVVPISHPVSGMVTEYVDFTGRANAVQTVNIVPRVTGYLKQISFKEGTEVKESDLLFEIDPRPYKAQFDAAKANL